MFFLTYLLISKWLSVLNSYKFWLNPVLWDQSPPIRKGFIKRISRLIDFPHFELFVFNAKTRAWPCKIVLNRKFNFESHKIFGEIEIMKIAPRPVLWFRILATGTIYYVLSTVKFHFMIIIWCFQAPHSWRQPSNLIKIFCDDNRF